MGNAIANLLIKIGADSYEVQQMAVSVEKNMRQMAKACHEYGKAMTTYVTLPLAAAAAVSVKNADERLQGEAKLLKSLHGQIGVQQRLLAIAGELQGKSTLDDDTITKQMAFFGTLQLTEAQIRKNTQASIEMSYALADQGVTFEMAAKSIAGMYSGSAGRLAKLVPELSNLTAAELKAGDGIDLLLKKYSGTAEYLSGQGLNPIKQLKNALGDLSEEVGLMLIPSIQSFARLMMDGIAKVEGFSDGTKVAIVTIGGLAAAAGPALMTLGEFVYLLPHIASGLTSILSPIGAVVVTLTAMGGAILWVMGAHDRFLNKAVSDKTKKYLSSGASVAELKKQREFELAENIKWNKKFEQTKDNLNPLKAQSAPYYFGNYVDNKKNYEEEFANASHYYSNVKAIDEAIKIKELSEQQASIEQSIFDAQNNITQGVVAENKEHKKTVGIIGELTEKLRQYSDLRDSSTSRDTIKYLNDQIAKLTDEIANLRSEGNSSVSVGGKSPFGGNEIKINPEDLAGNSEDWARSREEFASNVSTFGSSAKAVLVDLASVLSSGTVNLAMSFASGLGEMFAGVAVDNLGDGIIKGIGNFIKTLGTMLISLAITMDTFRKALNSIFVNPWKALALGVAMVAVGSAMTASINKKAEKGVALANGGLVFAPTMALVGDNRGAGSDPEVVAPLSKLKDYGLGSGGGSTIQFGGAEFVVRGSDLVLSLSRENARIERING